MTEKEKKLINLIRKIGHGEIKVIIQDSCPIRVEEFKKSIKL
ncbi:ATP-dependent DNA helicase RuvA [Clostridium formicaceticum]|nr:ATP-dependent DNA helicase RuvA [Clostridium formicaceticum]